MADTPEIVVAEAAVKIVPTFDQFETDLQTGLAAQPDPRVPIGTQLTKGEWALVQAQIAAIAKEQIAPQVGLDNAVFESVLATSTAMLKSLDLLQANPGVGLNTSAFYAQETALKAQLALLAAQQTTLKVGLTADGVLAKMALLDAALGAMGGGGLLDALAGGAAGGAAGGGGGGGEGPSSAALAAAAGGAASGSKGGKGGGGLLGFLGGLFGGGGGASGTAKKKTTGPGILSKILWGGLLAGGGAGAAGGLAGFGSLGDLVGFGPEGMTGLAIGTGGSLIGAGIGAGVLGAGALGTLGVGMGTDMAGIGQASGDIKNTYKAMTTAVPTTVGVHATGVTTLNTMGFAQIAYNQALITGGIASDQFKTATAGMQAQLVSYNAAVGQALLTNKTFQKVLSGFSPVAQQAVLGAAEQANAMHMLFNAATGTAERQGANIINQAMQAGEQFLPTVGKYATENMGIIENDLQPFFKWLDTAGKSGGLGIFTNLEKIFQGQLPTAMKAFNNGFQLLAKTITMGAAAGGKFISWIANFVTRMNTTTFSKWSRFIRTMISDFNAWFGVLKSLSHILEAVLPDIAHIGAGVAGVLSTSFNQIAGWIKSNSALFKTFFGAHFDVMIKGVGSVIEAILPVLEQFVDAFMRLEAPFRKMMGTILQQFAKSLPAVVGPLGQIFSTLSTALGGFLTALGPAFKAILGLLPGMLTLASLMASLLVPIFKALAPVLKSVGTILSSLVVMAVKTLLAVLQPLLPMIGLTMKAFLQLLTAVLKPLGPVIQVLTPLFVALAKSLGTELAGVVSPLSRIFKTLASAIHYILDPLAPTVRLISKLLADFLNMTGPMGGMILLVMALGRSFNPLTALTNVVPSLISMFQKLGQKIGTLATSFLHWGLHAVGIRGDMSEVTQSIAKLSSEGQDRVKELSLGMQQAFQEAGPTMAAAITDPVVAAITDLKEQIASLVEELQGLTGTAAQAGASIAGEATAVTAGIEEEAAAARTATAGLGETAGVGTAAEAMGGAGAGAEAGAMGGAEAGAMGGAEAGAMGGAEAGAMGGAEAGAALGGEAIAGATEAAGGLAATLGSVVPVLGMVGMAAMFAAPLISKLFSSGPTMKVVNQALTTFRHQLSSLPSTNITAIRGNLINVTNTIHTVIKSLANMKPTTTSFAIASGKIDTSINFIKAQEKAQAALTASTTVLGKNFKGVAASTIAQAAQAAHVDLAKGFTARQVDLLAQQLVSMGVISKTTAKTIEGSSNSIVTQWKEADTKAKKVDLVPPLNLTQQQLMLVKKAIKTTSTLAVANFVNSVKDGKGKFLAAAQWMGMTSKRIMNEMKTDFGKGGKVSVAALQASLLAGKGTMINTGRFSIEVPAKDTMASFKKYYGKTGALAMQLLGTGMKGASPAVQSTMSLLLTTLHKTAKGHLNFTPEGQVAATMLAQGLKDGTAHMVQTAEELAKNAALSAKKVDFSSAGLTNATTLEQGLKNGQPHLSAAASTLAMHVRGTVKGVDFGSGGQAWVETLGKGMTDHESELSAQGRLVASHVRGSVKGVDFSSAGQAWGVTLAQGMKDHESALSTEGHILATRARSGVKGVNFYSTGAGIPAGIAQGIRSGTSEVTAAAVQVVSNALAAAKSKAGIKSPSTLFASEVGLPIVQGIGVGFTQGIPDVVAAAKKGVTSLRASLGGSTSRSAAHAYTLAMKGAYAEHAEAMASERWGRGGTVTITAPVTVHASGGTPKALGESVSATLAKTLATAYKAKGGNR